MESDLHLAMKDAAVRHLVDGGPCSTEYVAGYTGLRVDVAYTRRGRRYLVECETRPSVERLIEKGRRRNRLPYRNVYILVVTGEAFSGLGWVKLRGYFDRILAYDEEADRFTGHRDLRRLGVLRDAALDVLVPVYYCDGVQRLLRLVGGSWIRFKNRVRWMLECPLCRLGVPAPWWRYCLRYECPPGRPLGMIVGSWVGWLRSWRS